ncbi:MAG: hypothetical protein CL605_00085 [Altibacter sp.]|uniref:hypothetical protein n=1 Tax=Altibacter sp. TaxID=2024823 RepID=UPI000C8F09CF|nr:hypothetical protein [Altibacter sp.]MAP53278.1 hypothetical protein [Altibacter sp.]
MMGDARFYYTPEPDGSRVVSIKLDESLGELFSEFLVNANDGITQGGSIKRAVGRMGELVTIQRDRLKLGEELANQFRAMQNHLDRGFSVAFTADDDKSWAAPLNNNPLTNSTTISVRPNPFNNLGLSSCLPSVDDYIVLETQPPAMLTETVKIKDLHTLSNSSVSQFKIKKGTVFAYDQPVFARYQHFWPVLKRPQSQIGRNMITNENGLLFSLSVTLIPDYDTLFAYHPNQYEGIDEIGPDLSRPEITTDIFPQYDGGRGVDKLPERYEDARKRLREMQDKLRALGLI